MSSPHERSKLLREATGPEGSKLLREATGPEGSKLLREATGPEGSKPKPKLFSRLFGSRRCKTPFSLSLVGLMLNGSICWYLVRKIYAETDKVPHSFERLSIDIRTMFNDGLDSLQEPEDRYPYDRNNSK